MFIESFVNVAREITQWIGALGRLAKAVSNDVEGEEESGRVR